MQQDDVAIRKVRENAGEDFVCLCLDRVGSRQITAGNDGFEPDAWMRIGGEGGEEIGNGGQAPGLGCITGVPCEKSECPGVSTRLKRNLL